MTLSNPCADDAFATIGGGTLAAKNYIITSGDQTFAQPTISINTKYASVCGDLVYSVKYGTVLAALTGSEPLSYTNPSFTINTDDDTLIDAVVPYQLTVKFADYQGSNADIYTT